VLNLDELLHKIPQLIARITKFQAFAVYLLDPRGEELSIAYAVGYPDEVVWTLRVKVGQGLVGTAVAEGQPILVNDVHVDPRYVEAVPGSNAELVVPLRRKGRVIGALNLLSETKGQFTEIDEMLLRQFGAHVAVAIENARLFEHTREYTSTLETLSEIGREFGAILNLDELLTRIANLTRRLIDYRTFGILLVNERSGDLEMKVAVRYGDKITVPRVKLGYGIVGYAALHKMAVNVPDVSVDPRYIKLVDDARSELAIPLMLQDRCVGVFDLESPELDAFSKSHIDILTLLASQAAVASRTPGSTSASDRTKSASRRRSASRSGSRRRCCRSNCRSGKSRSTSPRGSNRREALAVTSTTSSRRSRTASWWPSATYRAKACRQRSTARCRELVRSRTFRRRYAPERFTPSGVLVSSNTILYERQLEEYYCTLCYALFDVKRRIVTIANSGLPYPVRCSNDLVTQVEIAGVPLGLFAGSTYDEVTFDLVPGDVYVFCSDGVYDANDSRGREFGTERLLNVVTEMRLRPSREIVDAIFFAVQDFRGDTAPNDDMTAVAIRITNEGLKAEGSGRYPVARRDG
jgi:Serine phosphatase RsbU, regulator of sigma subunit